MSLIKEQIVDLELMLLPEYSAYILHDKFDQFLKDQYQFLVALDIPLLKFFERMPEEDILKMSIDGNRRLLTALQNQEIPAYIEYSVDNWLRNQLPIVSREDVIVEDISLINYARSKALKQYIIEYTSDLKSQTKIADEIDRFIMNLNLVLFKTYVNIQQEKVSATNEQLKQRESELLEAQALAKIGSFEWDLTGSRKSTFTPEVFRIFELEQTSNLEAFLDDVHPDDRVKLQAAIEKSFHDGIYECEYRYNRNGKAKILYTRGKVFFEHGKPVGMVGTVTDVTEKATLISRLTENEELSKQAQTLTNTGNWKWSIESERIEWSDEMYRIYGLVPQSESITFHRFLTFIHDDDRNKRIAEITSAVETGKASDYVMRINSADGKLKVLKGKGKVIVNKTGKSVGIMGTCQDITNEYALTAALERKNYELLQKNRDLESFNFIASHDLQEPLRKIQIYSSRIIDEGASEIPAHLLSYFKKISDASKRVQKMIEDFLVFYYALDSNAEFEAVDLNDAVSMACEELGERVRSNHVNISVEELPAIRCIKKDVVSMFKHLISNAIKFKKTDGIPAVTIKSKIEHESNSKPFIVISVSDNGIGFDEKYTGRIFELFQRLHNSDEYPGSGIGLSLCKKIAEQHNGWISVTSQPGIGSTFSIHLPYNAESEK